MLIQNNGFEVSGQVLILLKMYDLQYLLNNSGRGYQDSLYPGILVSLRAKRSNLPHFEIASAQSASQ